MQGSFFKNAEKTGLGLYNLEKYAIIGKKGEAGCSSVYIFIQILPSFVIYFV